MRHGRALARFCLEFVAILLGYDDPEHEYALRAALAAPDDAGAADAVAALARKQRRAYADHLGLVEPALQLLRGRSVQPHAANVLAGTALHALRHLPAGLLQGVQVQGTPLADAIDDAFRASQRQDQAKVTRVLRAAARQAPPVLAPILLAIAEVHGGDQEDDGEIIERLPVHRRTTPPPGFDLDRGRQSRADLVLAVLRAHDVQLRDVERGRIRPMTRDDLAEAILRDPFWDDIDASVQEDGVVEGILRDGKPSPAIDGTAFGQPHVYIKRIVR